MKREQSSRAGGEVVQYPAKASPNNNWTSNLSMTALGNKKRKRPTDFALLESYTSKRTLDTNPTTTLYFLCFYKFRHSRGP